MNDKLNIKVLVHCQVGASRSATLVLSHLINLNTDIKLKNLLENLINIRPIVFPNSGFIKKLKEKK